MAISMLQDAQTRNLAAALAGLKREDVDRSLSMSPPMSANNSATALYPGLQQAAAASAFSMLSPTQLLAANRQAAAAFMAAAQLPTMSSLASTLFPHHPALFGSWAAAAATQQSHLNLSAAPHSPPASPHSPVIGASTPSNLGKHGLLHNGSSPSSHSHSNDTLPPHNKKGRKLSVKKDLQQQQQMPSTPIDIALSVRSDIYHTPTGPISPPSSGSSPNSTHDGPTSHNNSSNSSSSKDPSRDKSFTCKTCHRSFGYKHVLQNHERTHTGEKPFECPECHKRFTRDHHLKTHMRLHTGEKPYHCTHCDKQFVQVANLRRHLRVHTGERPYTCEICDGRFSDSNQLKSHMLVHNGEKPFECERCHAKFRRRHHFLNHKCGIQSPPTPALSPAMSADYAMCDQKSAMGSSYGSEESMEVKSTSHHMYESLEHTEAPLDLSEDAASIDGNCGSTRNGWGGAGGLRKPHELKRLFRLPPPQIMQHLASELMPEQTEPEDLSMHSPRSDEQQRQTQSSPEPMMMGGMLHDDIDLDELDDAATLYRRQQQQQQQLLLQQQQLARNAVGMKME